MDNPKVVRVRIEDLMVELAKDHLDPIAGMFPNEPMVALIILSPGNRDIVMSNCDDLNPIVEAIQKTQGPESRTVDITSKVIH